MVLLVGAVVAIAGLVNDSGGADPPGVGASRRTSRAPRPGQDSGLAANVRLLENHLTLASGRRRCCRAGWRGSPTTGSRGSGSAAVIRRSRSGSGPPSPVSSTARRGILRPTEIEECIRRIEELSP